MEICGSRKRKSEVRIRKPGMTVRLGKIISGLTLSALLGITLAGCGGGGGGGNSTPGVINNAIGIGVVMQSRISIMASIGSSSSAGKSIVLPPNGVYSLEPARLLRTAGANTTFPTGSFAFIYLKWNPVNNATHYQVTYQGDPVWDSNITYSGDPAFVAANPQAYLNLDYQLKDKITAPGNYQFQINALNGSAVVAQSAVITVSLGNLLDKYPVMADNPYDSTTRKLSWTGVDKAAGYRVQVNYVDQNNVRNLVLDSGSSTLITDNFFTIPDNSGLTSGIYYEVLVDAWALDGSGNLAEIYRGVSGFTY